MTAPASPAVWSPAGPSDAAAALDSLRAFYAEEKLAFDADRQGPALHALLGQPALGAVFLLRAAAAPPVLGHLVLTWGHSLEFGGRFALLDELFVAAEARGQGLGRGALALAARWARSHGAQALRLEVARGNLHAQALYRQAGLVAEDRALMTLRLA